MKTCLKSTPLHLLRLGWLVAALSSTAPLGRADTAAVVTAANTLIATSTASGASPTVKTSAYTLAIAKQWTNLPGGTRNGPTIGGGSKALSTDLSATVPSGQSVSPRAAALALAQAALSDFGYTTMEEIRHADDVIRSTDNSQSWNYSNYHIAILGTPSTTSPWMLQISGHHLTYNITYNAPYVSATPMFIGTEPPDYFSIGSDFSTSEKAVVVGTISGVTEYLVSYPYNATSSTTTTTVDPGISSGTHRAPLETQRAAVSALATSIQADSSNASAGKLSGTFSDVVMGVTNSGDGNFPFIGTNPTYPTSTTGRGVLYTSLNATEQAQVRAMIEAWVNTQAGDVASTLLADYENDAALANTYVGYQVGAGSADGGSVRANFDAFINQEKTPINSQNSYLRVDGPRVWIEMVVQAAVAYRSQNFVHYHSLWRDKLADYGNEFGGFLDTTSTDITYTPPIISTQPSSYTVSAGGSATFSVVATGSGTLSYQWYLNGTTISGATSSSYTATVAGAYDVVVTNLYGATLSASATLTAGGSTGTTPTAAAPVLSSSGLVYSTVNGPFAYGITATNSPTTFTASNLPPGTNFDASSGLIAGFVPTAGTYVVNISASNAAGVSSASFTLVVNASSVPAPVLSSSGLVYSTVNGPFAYGITATNSPTTFTASNLPPGTNFDASSGLIAGFVPTAGTYVVNISASNAGGTSTASFTLVVNP